MAADSTPNNPTLGAFIRAPHRDARRLTSPITTDVFGTSLLYYTKVDGYVYTSTSVRALARLLGRVTVNAAALAEILSFGFVLRDETLLTEVRSIPAHTTLNLDGSLTVNDGPHATCAHGDAAAAAREFGGLLNEVIADLEPRWDVHCAGLTGGKDSRMLAALPKRTPDHWHWLTVSGRDDAEHRGSAATAERLGLEHAAWMEWTSAFLEGDVHRISADLANGVGAVSDHTLLRSYFDEYRRTVIGAADATGSGPALWIGTLADGLFAGTYLAPGADTIAAALMPRTAHLPSVLSPDALERYAHSHAYYESNPFQFTSDRADDTGWFIRMFTRGRLYVCRSLSCFDQWPGAQINPYLHPEMVALALRADTRLLAADALRDGVLRAAGPGLDEKSAFGYRAPAYAHHVFRTLAGEVARCQALDGVVARSLVDEMKLGQFPDLSPPADLSQPAGPSYRVHADEPQPVIRSLRDYEHILVYATFLNLLQDDGIVAG